MCSKVLVPVLRVHGANNAAGSVYADTQFVRKASCSQEWQLASRGLKLERHAGSGHTTYGAQSRDNNSMAPARNFLAVGLVSCRPRFFLLAGCLYDIDHLFTPSYARPRLAPKPAALSRCSCEPGCLGGLPMSDRLAGLWCAQCFAQGLHVCKDDVCVLRSCEGPHGEVYGARRERGDVL